jgi:hypothetical protein
VPTFGENVEKIITKVNESQKEVIVKGVVQADYTESKKQLQVAIAAKKVPAQHSLRIWMGYFQSQIDLTEADIIISGYEQLELRFGEDKR